MEKISNKSRLPAFATPADTLNVRSVFDRLPQDPSHVNEGGAVVVVVAADWRIRHANSVNPDTPEELKAAIAKQICDPRDSPPTDHSVTFGPTL